MGLGRPRDTFLPKCSALQTAGNGAASCAPRSMQDRNKGETMADSICPHCRKPLLPEQSMQLLGSVWVHADCDESDDSHVAQAESNEKHKESNDASR